MKIKLKKLILENFKGVTKSSIDFDGEDVNIYGDNATGKTTHLDAYIWCLFNKDSSNSANFEIKTLDATGESIHNLTHTVTVVLDVDGSTLTLTKSMTEKWTRKRGEKSKQFTGHITTYYIDETPVKKQEFDKLVINTIGKEQGFRILTDARYFNEQMTWKKRRELLMTVCGDVTTEEVISANPDLANIPEILAGKSLDDARKRLNGTRKKINKEIESIPARIDEASRAIQPLPMPVKDAEVGLKALAVEKEEMEKELTALANGGEAVKLQELKAKKQKAVNEFEADKAAKLKEAKTRLDLLEEVLVNKKKEKDNLEDNFDHNLTATEEIKAHLKALRERWYAVNNKVYDGSDICPTCGQTIPKEQINAAIKKFNSDKAESLKKINEDGKAQKKTLTELESAREAMTARMKEINAELEELTSKIEPIKIEIDNIKTKKFESSQLDDEIHTLETQTINNEAVVALKADLKQNALEIEKRQKILAVSKANLSIESRINDLMVKEEDLVGELTAIEKQLFTLDEFTRARVDLLETKINEKFKIARFKMFADQINGGLQETCETTLNGVPYNSINNGGRIQVGMDIISTLQRYYGMSCPVWLDNRESVNQVPEIDAQVISLIVNEQDKQLRIEKREN